MSGALLFNNGTEWKPLGAVTNITEVLPTGQDDGAGEEYLTLASGDTLTLTATISKKNKAAWRKLVPSYRKYKMELRRYYKRVARQKRLMAYRKRASVRADIYRTYGVSKTYYNGVYRKLIVVIKDKWGFPLAKKGGE